MIWLSGCATTPYVSVPPPTGTYHIVGSGQTLYSISKVYNVDLKELMRVNGIRNPGQLGVGERLFIPRAPVPLYIAPYHPREYASIEQVVGKKQYEVKWKYITLHHSATLEGSAEAFDRNHRMRKMGGLFYHFVVGNGKGSGDGEIEVGWRWRKQKEVDRKRDIQICLVGDYNRQEMTAGQEEALTKLLKVLVAKYDISVSNIRRHKDIEGRATECPGDSFDLARIKKIVRNKN